MIKIPRSLAIGPPYRGRTIRSLIRSKIPGGKKLLDAYFLVRARRISSAGSHRLASGRPEGRRFITAIPHPFCGIGHSHAEWHTAFQWASILHLEFVHVPLKDRWNGFFGATALPDFHDVLRQQKPLVIRLPYAKWSYGEDALAKIAPFVGSIRSHRNLLFVLADGQNTFDHITHAGRFREQFERRGEWQSLPLHHLEGKLNVAVHLRRGDVVGMAAERSSNWNQRFVSEEYFVKIMEEVKAVAESRDVCFHIYSQGALEDFPLVRDRNDCVFHLNADEKETLLNMARASVLIMSPSGFSYLAAMLSTGLKIARYPWWHHLPENSQWVRVPSEGSYDRLPALGEKLAAIAGDG